MPRSYTLLIYILLLVGCATHKPHYSTDYQGASAPAQEPDYSLFFFGGADKSPENTATSIKTLQRQFETVQDGALILLGNNGPKRGMPHLDSTARRSHTEALLDNKLSLLKKFKGEVYVVPGNHDWGDGGRKGYQKILALQGYVNDSFGEDSHVVVPENGCPGPYEVQVNDGLVYLFLNTQWWFHGWDKPSCDMVDEFDYIIQLEDAMKRNANKKVVVVGHHPIYSNGAHGGNFPFYAHLTPPILGSLYVWYRKHVGGLQDLSELRYKMFSKGMQQILSQHPNAIYLSGHERSLQYHKPKDDQHYIVSGAMAKASATVGGNSARFAYGEPGFGRLNFYQNGDVFLEFWTGDKLAFREKLYNQVYDPSLENQKNPNIDFSGQTVSAIATTKLNRKPGKTKPGLLGNSYRKEWGMEIKDVPVIDIGKERGGLKIVQRGGGQQTKSLRLQAEDGRQYTLRSVEKFPENAVPRALRGTIASNLVSDQVSASHPYGALGIPVMAKAAGVHHTSPKLVYLPDDPRLGRYREDFGNGLYLYEERPATENWSDYENFGNPRNIKSTFDLMDDLQKKSEYLIDEEQVVRSRLFDILIGDWDRHDDQWRFAEFRVEDVGVDDIPAKIREKVNSTTDKSVKFRYYQPIPRDRDQAFFLSDGSLIKMSSHKWGQPKFQGFHEEISNVSGLEFNARHFDRTFLVESTLEEWESTAADIQKRVTDQVIEESIKNLPKEIYAINGEKIIRKLKKRRDDLQKYAREHYLFLAKTVDVVGSKKAERFEVSRRNEQETEVKMYRIKEKTGEAKYLAYHRVFNTDQTKEIRLFGLGDNDQFIITGAVKKGPIVRVIGGKGKDHVDDQSKVSGISKKNQVYDTKHKTTIISNGEVRNRTSDKDEEINGYDRYEFQYNKLMPLVYLGANPDDGLMIGGGFSFMKNGFRKTPFASKHTLSGSFAPKSGSYNFKYKSEYNQVIGKWDFLFEADVFQPNYADFFYGFGNKTAFDEDSRDHDTQFYRVRYGQVIIKPEIRRTFGEVHSLRMGGYFRAVEIDLSDNDEAPNRFIANYSALSSRTGELTRSLFDTNRHYIAGTLDYSLDSRDSKAFPTRGVRWNVAGKIVSQLQDEENDHQIVSSDLSMYFTFGGSLKTTLAVRVGGQANFGDFEFYQAPRLGGFNNLRGYRKVRFTGDESFYQNTDLRIRLKQFRTPVFPGSFGISLIHDLGRVWTEQEDVAFTDDSKEDWHQGYGAGLWISPLGAAVITAEYTLSNDDESALYIRFGFLF
jgi:hypothetical protein